MIKPFAAKRFVLGTTAIACALALGACGAKEEAKPSQQAAAKEQQKDPVTQITFWHSMEGELGVILQSMADDFNAKNPKYKIVPIYKGSYGESMNAAIAAYRAKQAPDIVQVFEVGTANMIHSNGAIKPVQEMSEEVGNPIDPNTFIGAIAGYYSDHGKLVSLPFNSSTAVMYYNKDLFTKAGLDPNTPPKTYADLKNYADKLKKAGVECSYTTTWPAWILLENASAWHNVPYATKNNGFDGLDARLSINNPVLGEILGDLAQMSKDGTFTYGGRADSGAASFVAGKCAMMTASSGNRAQILKDGKFNFGMTQLPYLADVPGAPQNSVIGGASLWVFSGKQKPVYEGITSFFHYLTSPEVAARWHQTTGYVPVTKAAYELTKEQGYYDKNPGTDIPVKQLNVATTDASRGLRLGSLPAIRDEEEAIMERIFSGSVSVTDGLAEMQNHGNEILNQFENDHK